MKKIFIILTPLFVLGGVFLVRHFNSDQTANELETKISTTTEEKQKEIPEEYEYETLNDPKFGTESLIEDVANNAVGDCLDDPDKDVEFKKIRTFLTSAQVQDGRLHQDFCIPKQVGMSDTLAECTCKNGVVDVKLHYCFAGCEYGVCRYSPEEGRYINKKLSDDVRWRYGSIEYTIVSAYLGSYRAPYGTKSTAGDYYALGENIYALVFTIEIVNNGDAFGTANTMQRIVSERGDAVRSNTFYFKVPYSEEYTLPAGAKEVVEAVFIVSPAEEEFLIRTGGYENVHFIVKVNKEGDLIIETTEEIG